MSRILAIEDSASIRLLLVRRLERVGHRVKAAAEPVEALAWFQGKPGSRLPDLILLDLGLPGGNGLDALPRIVEATPGVPVVLLSARHDLDRLETPVEVAGRVAKPIDFDRLLRLIADLTATGRSPRP